MANAATLTVKILADISDFEKNLPKSERAFLRTADNLTEAGKKLALGVTLPLVALGAAISKAAAEDEASVAKLQRTFGTSAKTMESWISQLMATVPATDDEIRGLAVSTDTLLRSMGLGSVAAMKMTQNVTKLAGDLAAYNHVELGVAQDALEKALAGKTKGLQEFGIVMNEADIKTRAYQLGLARVGAELTHTQTAQAAWSLILERSKLQQGEAARTIDEGANALKRLRQSADSAADSFGAVVLPTAARVVGAISDMLNGLAQLSPVTKSTIVVIGALAAATGPALIGIGSLTRSVIVLRGALAQLSGTTAMAGFASSLSLVAVAAGLIAAPVATIIHAFNKQGEAARNAAADLDQYKSAIGNLTQAQLKQQAQASQGALIALEAQRRSIAGQIAALPKAGTSGYDVETTPGQLQGLSAQLSSVVAQQAAVRGGFDAIIARLSEMNAKTAGGDGQGLAETMKAVEERAQSVLQSIEQMKKGWAPLPGLGVEWGNTLREAERVLASIPNKLDPIAVKVRGIVQELRDVVGTMLNLSNLPGASIAMPDYGKLLGFNIKTPAGPAQTPASPVITAATARLAEIKDALTAGFESVATAIGTQLAQNLAIIIGSRGGVGAGIGGTIGGAFGSGVAKSILGTGAGAIGNAVVPVVGGLIGTVVGGLLGGAIGGLFGSHKKAVDNSANSLNTLATTAQKVTEALSNIPQGFKIAYDRYLAAAAVTVGDGGSAAPGTGSTGGTGSNNGNRVSGGGGMSLAGATFNLYGIHDARALFDELGRIAETQGSRGGTSGLALSFGGTG